MEVKTLELDSILLKEKESLNNLRTQLIQKGWAIVILPENLITLLNKIIDPIEEFFNLSPEYKASTNWNHVFGFTSVTHKESFRWLTKDLLITSFFPKELKDCLVELTNSMDNLMIDLISSTGSVLFSNPESLGSDYNIPLLQKESAQWSMLDIAYYFNNAQKFADSNLVVDENCAPHYDPGLLSLSILSTHRGLELYNPVNDEWISHTGEDRRLGVIWCGKAAQTASAGLLRPATHKVIRQLDKPRIAIWYEICTADQVPLPAREAVHNLTKEKTKKEKGLTLTNELNIEREYGIPMTKLAPLDIEGSIQKKSNPSILDNLWKNLKDVFTVGPSKNNNDIFNDEYLSGIPVTKSGIRRQRGPQLELLKSPKNKNNEPFSGIPITKDG